MNALHIAPDKIITFGHSLGGSAAVDIAFRHRVAGLVMESSFISAFRVLTRIPLLPFDKFRNVPKIQKVHCPVLVVHGKADSVISFYHGQRLYDAANEPKRSFWVQGAGHNDLPMIGGSAYYDELRRFAELIELRNAEGTE